MKGADSYANGTKETWRGWQWNRIVELLCDGRNLGPAGQRERLRDKTVLYLVGPDDKDRECAVKRGFRSENCIAVDIDKERVSSVRDNGGTAVCLPMHAVLRGFKDRIDVVVADFCHGLTQDAMELVNVLRGANVEYGSVISINLLRGRDKDSEWLRKEASLCSIYKRLGTNPKSRVAALLFDFMCSWCHVDCYGHPDEEDINNFLASTNPSFASYRSPESGQYFDTVIFRWPDCGERNFREYLERAKGMPLDHPDRERFVREAEEVLQQYMALKCEIDVEAADAFSRLSTKSKCLSQNITGKLAALLAVRTMKLRKVKSP